jgi:hypothetical protein
MYTDDDTDDLDLELHWGLKTFLMFLIIGLAFALGIFFK